MRRKLPPPTAIMLAVAACGLVATGLSACAEPATSSTEPATSSTEPATSSTEPATSSTEPATSSTEPATSSDGDVASTFESAFTCEQLADRWVTLQQGYLDRLDDADDAELDEGSNRVKGAGLWIAQAMLEQVRDSQAAGCAEDLASGSSALCSRVSQLQANGEGGEGVVSGLIDGCA